MTEEETNEKVIKGLENIAFDIAMDDDYDERSIDRAVCRYFDTEEYQLYTFQALMEALDVNKTDILAAIEGVIQFYKTITGITPA